MSIQQIVRKAGSKIATNSPRILTFLACTGVISTVIFAARATPNAQLIVDGLKDQYKDKPIPKAELVKAVAPVYIPTGLMACITIGCMIGANQISAKRNAVLASLYSTSELALREYQERVMAKIGEKKEKEIQDEIAAEHITKNPIRDREVILTGKGQSLCYDTLSGRYFLSDYDSVLRVESEINRRIINDMWVVLNDVYYELGLKPIDLGEYVGWNVDNLLHFTKSSCIADDGRPCLVLGYESRPLNVYTGF